MDFFHDSSQSSDGVSRWVGMFWFRSHPIVLYCLRWLHVVHWHRPFDGDLMLRKAPRIARWEKDVSWWIIRRYDESRPSNGIPCRSHNLVNKSGPSSMLHIQCRSEALEPSTCRKVCRWSPHLLLIFKHVSWLMIAWTQVHAINGLRSSSTALMQPRVLQR